MVLGGVTHLLSIVGLHADNGHHKDDEIKPKTEQITPVMPMAVTKTEAGVMVEWSAIANENLEMYVVQRSRDGINFKPVGMVMAKDDPNSYQFTDKHAKDGAWFYRIVSVDHEGNGHFGKIICVH